MFCPNCGNNCGDARFCSACGTQLIHDRKASRDDSFKHVMLLCDEFLGDELGTIMQEHAEEHPENHVDTPEESASDSDEQFLKELKSIMKEPEQQNLTLLQELDKRRPCTFGSHHTKNVASISYDIICPRCGSTKCTHHYKTAELYKYDFWWTKLLACIIHLHHLKTQGNDIYKCLTCGFKWT